METLPSTSRYGLAFFVLMLHIVGIWAILQVPAVREVVAGNDRPLFVSLITEQVNRPQTQPATPTPVEPKQVEKKSPSPVVQKPREKSPVLTSSKPAAPTETYTAPPVPEEKPAQTQLAASEQKPSITPATPSNTTATESTSSNTSSQPSNQPKTVASSAVRYKNKPNAAYPPQSRRLGEEGRVLLHVLIGADGNPQKVELKESSGYNRLDESAIAATLKATFYPYEENGRALAVWALLPITFNFKD